MPHETVGFHFPSLERLALGALSCHLKSPTTMLERPHRETLGYQREGEGPRQAQLSKCPHQGIRNMSEVVWDTGD